MAFVRSQRFWETSTTTGTNAMTLAGAVTGYRAFSSGMSDQDTIFYTIVNQAVTTEWENGLGTFNSGAGTLSRTTIFDSSNSGAIVTFSAGTKDVFSELFAKADNDIYGTVETADILTVTTGHQRLFSPSLTLLGTLILLDGSVTII